MTAGRRDLERAARQQLPAHVREVGRRTARSRRRRRGERRDGHGLRIVRARRPPPRSDCDRIEVAGRRRPPPRGVGAGQQQAARPSRRRAAAAIGSTPRAGWMAPSSDSSPSTSTSSTSRRRDDARCREDARARSEGRTPSPALRTSAGARLTVMRCGGNSKPELRIALRTRSRLSRTLGVRQSHHRERRQAERHVHLDVAPAQASMPKTAAVRTHASTPQPAMQAPLRLMAADFSGKRRPRTSGKRSAAELPRPRVDSRGLCSPAARQRALARIFSFVAGRDRAAVQAVPALDLRDARVEQLARSTRACRRASRDR